VTDWDWSCWPSAESDSDNSWSCNLLVILALCLLAVAALWLSNSDGGVTFILERTIYLSSAALTQLQILLYSPSLWPNYGFWLQKLTTLWFRHRSRIQFYDVNVYYIFNIMCANVLKTSSCVHCASMTSYKHSNIYKLASCAIHWDKFNMEDGRDYMRCQMRWGCQKRN